VSNAELKEEFALFEQRLEKRLAQMATKSDLEVWGGALHSRIESGERRLDKRIDELGQRLDERIDELGQRLDKRIDGVEQRLRADLGKHIDEAEQRLHADLAMFAKAHQESMATLISVIDEKYADLPARVKRLEGAVFHSKRR
jgi:hypothetical protein